MNVYWLGREIHFSFKKRHGQRLDQPSRVTRFVFHLCPNSVCRQHPKRRCWGSCAMACCMEVWSSWGRGAAKPTRFGSTEWRKSFFFSICSSSQMMDQLAPTLPSGLKPFGGWHYISWSWLLNQERSRKGCFSCWSAPNWFWDWFFYVFLSSSQEAFGTHFSNVTQLQLSWIIREFLPPGCPLCAFTLHSHGCLLLPTAPPQTAQRRCSFR